MSIINLQEPLIVDIPASQYYADHSAWSQSMLKTFLDRRRLAEAYYIAHSHPEPEGTDPMRKGTAAHTALLQPELFDSLVIAYPRNVLDKRGYASTNDARDFAAEQEAAGRMVFKSEQIENIRAMAESVRRVCGKWLGLPGEKEKSIYWTDEATGLRCKARLDWTVYTDDMDFIFDLKTTADASPRAFRKRCEDMFAWIQADHYTAGLQAIRHNPTSFMFIAVEQEFPYAVSLHEMDAESISSAIDGRRDVLTQVKRCLETNDWSEPWERMVNPLQIREWAFCPSLT